METYEGRLIVPASMVMVLACIEWWRWHVAHAERVREAKRKAEQEHDRYKMFGR